MAGHSPEWSVGDVRSIALPSAAAVGVRPIRANMQSWT